MKHAQADDVAGWAGIEVDEAAFDRLARFETWLASEAYQAGGIGPDEIPVLWERHVLDSLMFAVGLGGAEWVVDVGTGVGLPGLPLAVVLPEREFVLLDRSGRRVRLVRRIARILGLANVEVVEDDAADWLDRHGPAPALVMRGVFQPEALPAFVERHVAGGGTAVVGAGLDPVALEGSELVRYPGSAVLEPGRWLRIMRRP